MTVTDPKPIASSVLAEVAESFRQGLAHNEIIARMRARGLHKIDCMKLFREYGGVSLGEAKDIVHFSPFGPIATTPTKSSTTAWKKPPK